MPDTNPASVAAPGSDAAVAVTASVAIPAYMNEATIVDTLMSVKKQNLRPLEIVVCDDCSSDRTFELAENFRKTFGSDDLRIRVIRNEKRLGMAGNWNKCVSLCNGEYVKLLCGDDLIAPELMEREVRILDGFPEVLSVESDTVFIDEKGRKTGGGYRRYRKHGVTDGREIAMYSLFHRDYFGAPLANTFRKRAYEECGGFDEGFDLIADYDFFLRLGIAGKVYIIHEPLNYFRVRRGSNTSGALGKDSERYVEEHERMVRKHAVILGLSEKDIRSSVRRRRFMNRLGNVYLRVFHE